MRHHFCAACFFIATAIAAGQVTCPCAMARGATNPPTNVPATQPVLREIETHDGIYLMRVDRRITITSGGYLRSIDVDNKSYGPNDRVVEKAEVRHGQLTPEQISELAKLFADWERQPVFTFPRGVDGWDVDIRYGDKTVSGDMKSIPASAQAIYQKIRAFAELLPRDETASTRPPRPIGPAGGA